MVAKEHATHSKRKTISVPEDHSVVFKFSSKATVFLGTFLRVPAC